MTIIRSPRITRDFTVISNSVCLDERLPMRALGLLVRLLCRPDNWKTNSETLAREFGVGREQMRATLQELVAAGYMALQKQQDAAGHWSSHWVVFDEPAKQPAPSDPKSGPPEPGKPYAGGLGAITRTDLTRTDNNPLPPKGEPVADGFAEFWAAWPNTARKANKKGCLNVWTRRKLEGKADEIISHVEGMKQSKPWKEGFEPAPLTYLNQERWADGVQTHDVQDNSFAGVI